MNKTAPNTLPIFALRRLPSVMVSVLAAAILGSSCGGGLSPEVPECACLAPLNVTVALEGGGVDELLSLIVSLEDVRLLQAGDSANGVDGANILRESESVEVLGLDQRAQGLATGFYSENRIDRIRVTLSKEPPVARDLAGVAVKVSSPTQRTFTMTLPTPILVPDGYVRNEIVVVELDAAASLTESAAGDSLDFNPVLRARVVTEGQPIRVETIRGRVYPSSFDGAVSVFSGDGSLHDHTGFNVRASFTQDTTFYDESALESIDQEEFMMRLGNSQVLVSANGSWKPSTSEFGVGMSVTSIRLTGPATLQTGQLPALVEGRVVGPGAPGEIRVRVVEVGGNQALKDALAAQGDPETMTIVPRIGALIYGEDGAPIAASDLSAGARIRATIAAGSFTGSPFLTTTIVQLEAPEHRGTLMEDATEIALFLADGEAAVEAGTVLSPSTPISLQLAGEAPVLDVVGRPSLQFSDLLPPLRVAASGTLTGDPSDPTLTNATLVIRPGRLDGLVSAVDVVSETFDASVETIHAPFGGSATSPPFQFLLDANCVFEGSATTRAGFFALFSALEPGESLAVSVAGLGTVNANEVVAYEVRSRVD